jgi:hypothetical protein
MDDLIYRNNAIAEENIDPHGRPAKDEFEEFSEEDNTKAADTSVAAECDADNSLDELLDAAMKDNQED